MDYDTPVVILCGGQGTRIREVSERLPKAMVDIGGRPILWHIMKLYSHYGYRRFILCLGYKGWEIKQFFLDYRSHMSDFTLSLSEGDHQPWFRNGVADENWEITFAETGLEAGTGARLRRIRDYIDTPQFMMTYGDGVSAVDIGNLAKVHADGGRIGTVTGVHPTSKFGEMHVDGNVVAEFNEKPTQVSGWVSGGYFVFERSFLDDYLDDERGPVPRGGAAAAAGPRQAAHREQARGLLGRDGHLQGLPGAGQPLGQGRRPVEGLEGRGAHLVMPGVTGGGRRSAGASTRPCRGGRTRARHRRE